MIASACNESAEHTCCRVPAPPLAGGQRGGQRIRSVSHSSKLLLQANKNAKKGQKSGTSVTEALSNPFVLFLVLVLLQLGFDT